MKEQHITGYFCFLMELTASMCSPEMPQTCAVAGSLNEVSEKIMEL